MVPADLYPLWRTLHVGAEVLKYLRSSNVVSNDGLACAPARLALRRTFVLDASNQHRRMSWRDCGCLHAVRFVHGGGWGALFPARHGLRKPLAYGRTHFVPELVLPPLERGEATAQLLRQPTHRQRERLEVGRVFCRGLDAATTFALAALPSYQMAAKIHLCLLTALTSG
jgi:hypothetical protein